MIPMERLHVVSPQQSLNDVVPLMASRNINQLPVVQKTVAWSVFTSATPSCISSRSGAASA